MALAPLVSRVFNKPKCYGLNFDDKHPFSNLLDDASQGYTQSDCDEQLVLHFAFNEILALSGFKIEPTLTTKNAPRSVKLYLNLASFSFEDVGRVPPALEWEIKSFDEIIPLKQVLFSKVNSITLFIESNQEGEECTSLAKVHFFGKPKGTTDMSQLKKAREEEEE